jgi:phage-related protein (TIGR01555 family)
MMQDKLSNLVASLATGNAKSVHDQFGVNVLHDGQLEAMYRGDWLSRKVVDLPIVDLLRPWRSWQATKEQITTIEEAEERWEIQAKIKEAMEWARCYGGAAIIIGADTGNPALPLNPKAIGKGGLKYLTTVQKREIRAVERNLDPVSPFFRQPRHYTVSSSVTGEIEIHPSRVIRFIGKPNPNINTNPEGWGDSILQVVYDAIHAAALAHTGIAELIHEAKVDVINVKGIGAMLSTTEGTQQLVRRFQNASMMKSINNTLLLDAEDKHTRTQTTFAGLHDVLMVFMQIVAAAADIPVTRLLGTSAKGLNATGEGDQKNYHEMLDSIRQYDLRPKLKLLDEILWRDATGLMPVDVHFTFNPLSQMTAVEEADLAAKKATTAKTYVDMAIMPEEALAKSIVNSLIEDGTYPGLEAAIEEEVGEGGDLIPEDPHAELELERGHAELQAIANAPKGKPTARDRAASRAPNGGVRDRLADDAEYLSQVYLELDAIQRDRGRQG